MRQRRLSGSSGIAAGQLFVVIIIIGIVTGVSAVTVRRLRYDNNSRRNVTIPAAAQLTVDGSIAAAERVDKLELAEEAKLLTASDTVHSQIVADNLNEVTTIAGSYDDTTNFCATIGAKSDSFASSAKQRMTNGNIARENRTKSAAADRERAIQKLSTERIAFDEKRSENFSKLRAKASDSNEKAALETYIETAQTSLASRREAINKALVGIGKDFDTTLSAYNNELPGTTEKYLTSVTLAATKASEVCVKTSESEADIATQLKDSILAAKKDYTKWAADNSSDANGIIKRRQDSANSANQAYQEAIQAAQNTVKGAFSDQAI